MKKIIFFDGVCGLCNGFVDFVLKQDRSETYQFCALQSEKAESYLKTQHLGLESVVLYDQGQVYEKSAAVLRVLFSLGHVWTVLSILGSVFPRFLRDGIYDLVAKNRYSFFGKKDFCRIPTESEKERFLS